LRGGIPDSSIGILMAMIPTTILTGFLSAGKTTLLNRILQEEHGMRIAVIENEFGQENIDNEILVQDSNEHIIEMNNGCICCTVRGDLIVALSNWRAARSRPAGSSTASSSNHGPGQSRPGGADLLRRRGSGHHYMLDAMVTVVDARHAMKQLDEHEEAQRQVGFADKLLLSKTDLVSPRTGP
jgi:G3E family GTPase